jgi:hypothetical protein
MTPGVDECGDVMVSQPGGRWPPHSCRADTLLIKRGGHNVLYGSAPALAAAVQAWSQETDTQMPDLTRTMIP